MTEPFRDSGGSCPQCSSTPLREFQKRLVCDKCEGMLISSSDLATSMHELGATVEELEAKDVEDSNARCPRCAQPMQSCTLHLGKHSLHGRYLRCAGDGIWMAQQQMIAEFARTSRKMGSPRGLSTNAASAYADASPTGSPTSALQGIGNAFSKNQRKPIGYTPPKVRIAFVSAFHGRALACPACSSKPALDFIGDRWVCKSCAGSFVEDAALVAMVSDIKASPWEMPAVSGPTGSRDCSVCAKPMATEKFGDVTIDRCRGHGTWFDDTELAAVLVHASETQDKPGGIGAWLRRLFT